jgi:hypothetical protein
MWSLVFGIRVYVPRQAVRHRDPLTGSHVLDDFLASFVVIAATHSLILR